MKVIVSSAGRALGHLVSSGLPKQLVVLSCHAVPSAHGINASVVPEVTQHPVTGEGTLRVVVVDGHPVFAEALTLSINLSGLLSCVGTAVDVEQALALVDELAPDVIVMDVLLAEGADGIAGTRQLRERHPEIRVLILTGQLLSASLVLAANEAGASALLPKSTSLAIVVDAISALREHSFMLDRQSLTSLLAAASSNAPIHAPPRAGVLTAREHQILELLASGSDIQLVATRLGIKVSTCRGYLKNLYLKLGVHSQLEVVAVARAKGLLDDAY